MIKRILVLNLMLAASLAVAQAAAAAPLQSFHPGEIWPDNNGVHINAHGGGILFHEGVYYWFGQHMIEGSAGNFAQVGVHVYSSRDLYNWKDEGIAFAVSTEPNGEIRKGCILERPKVIRNAKTGKFVMWFHYEADGSYQTAQCAVAVADKVTGPYRFVARFRPNAGIWPLNVPEGSKTTPSSEELDKLDGANKFFRRDHVGGQMARDMTLFVDDDGTAYHIYSSEENGTLHISQLTDDYLKPAEKYYRVLPGGVNEAPALFKHQGKYYMISSGCTGWAPNAARLAVADHIGGPWTELGNPCVGPADRVNITFEGQSTHVLPVSGKPDAFIFMADRWRPDNAIDGRHLWYPFVVGNDGKVQIEEHDEWDLSIFNLKPFDAKRAPRITSTSNDTTAKPDTASFKWDAIPGAAGYRIHRNGRLIKFTNRLTFSQSGLTPGTRNAYTVTAVTLDGRAGQSSKPFVVLNPGQPQDHWLDEMEPVEKVQEWGELRRKASVTGGPLIIGQTRFARGLGTHANGRLVYQVPAYAGRFEAWVGLDAAGPNGSIRFQVLCDGQVKFDSGVMRAGDAAKRVDLPLSGVFVLELVASDAGDGNSHDHADWADASIFADKAN